MAYTAVQLIEMKRDGRALPADAIEWIIAEYTNSSIPDYQMSALAMAIYFNGLDDAELEAWTGAMLHSGEILDFSHIAANKIDKHSTGGVGDKISIPLAPLVAACGVAVPMMSGRGLGHTGGTLDKLESIPGFDTQLDRQQFSSILEHHGLVMAGQSSTMAPADKKLYGLRDATGTVPSIPLIASSIMSKKLAEGLDGLVLDVKTGSGAFMVERGRAHQLAREMVDIGESRGIETVALLSDMSQPLGREVGNANEIKESIEVLMGEGPDDVTELTLALGEIMLELAGIEGGRDLLDETIVSGRALQKFIDVVEAHGGDAGVIEDPSRLPVAEHVEEVEAPRDGYVTRCDALTVGEAAMRLGAGRRHQEDTIDPAVGITLYAKVGAEVAAGDVLATVQHNSSDAFAAHHAHLRSAWEISDTAPEPNDLILERLDASTI